MQFFTQKASLQNIDVSMQAPFDPKMLKIGFVFFEAIESFFYTLTNRFGFQTLKEIYKCFFSQRDQWDGLQIFTSVLAKIISSG